MNSNGLLENRVTGLLVGQAAGDMRGAPFEFMEIDEYQTLPRDPDTGLILDHILHPRSPKFAYTTDDTAHALIVAKSFIACGRFDIEDIAQRLVKWYDGGAADGLGGSTAIACKLMDPLETNPPVPCNKAGQQARKRSPFVHQGRNNEVGYEVSSVPSNGPLMRAPVVGLLTEDLATLQQASHDLTMLTHDYPINYITSEVVAVMVQLAVAGKSKDQIFAHLKTNYAHVLDHCEAALLPDVGEAMSGRGEELKGTADYGYGGSAATTLGVVLESLRTNNTFESSVLYAINARDIIEPWCWDTDTYGALTGAIAGALYGYDDIPQSWLNPIHPRVNIPVAMSPVSAKEIVGIGWSLAAAIDRSQSRSLSL